MSIPNVVQLDSAEIEEFHREGFLHIAGLLDSGQVQRYRELYNRFLEGAISTGHLRADLAGPQGDDSATDSERITQIMWPSAVVPPLLDGPLHQHAIALSRQLFGGDMDFDFDMLINKPPRRSAATPWHQDAAYWVDLPDCRAVSFWVALDEATVDNGCMWFVPGSHLEPMRKHHQDEATRALECEATESEAEPVPLKPGDATVHHGRTLHYSRANSTDADRRAVIVNCRPALMVKMERDQGMDHGLAENVSLVRSAGAN